MKQLVFKRPEERFNRNHEYDIYVSGNRVGSLQNGENTTVTVAPDAGTLEIRLLWCGSGEIVLDGEAQEEVFEVRGNSFLNRKLAYFGVIVPLVGLMLTWTGLPKGWIAGVLGIFLAGIVGTLTVWRDRWIRARRVNRGYEY